MRPSAPSRPSKAREGAINLPPIRVRIASRDQPLAAVRSTSGGCPAIRQNSPVPRAGGRPQLAHKFGGSKRRIQGSSRTNKVETADMRRRGRGRHCTGRRVRASANKGRPWRHVSTTRQQGSSDEILSHVAAVGTAGGRAGLREVLKGPLAGRHCQTCVQAGMWHRHT